MKGKSCNKPNEKPKSDYVRKLPYSTKWKRTGTDSDVGWYYQQRVRMRCKKINLATNTRSLQISTPRVLHMKCSITVITEVLGIIK